MTYDASAAAPQIDTAVPHSARIWNHWLGGKDNYEVDRVAGDQFRAAFPAIADNALAFRHFLARGVRYLADDAGLRQFLDIGTGLPTVDNTHEIAQRVAPESRIVYVDNDPLVLVHARALLTSAPEGATDYLDADLRDVPTILREAAATLDFGQPVGLILSGILGHFPDEDAAAAVRELLAALPGGSHLLVCDGADTSPELNAAQEQHNASGQVVYHLRGAERFGAFFDGLDLVEPGVVRCTDWRREPSPFEPPAGVHAFGAIGRKR